MPVEVNCAWCGKAKQIKPYQAKISENHFCSNIGKGKESKTKSPSNMWKKKYDKLLKKHIALKEKLKRMVA